jgi:hypothetical protein
MARELMRSPDMEAVAEHIGMPNLTHVIEMLWEGRAEAAESFVHRLVRRWAEEEAEKLFNQPRGSNG